MASAHFRRSQSWYVIDLLNLPHPLTLAAGDADSTREQEDLGLSNRGKIVITIQRGTPNRPTDLVTNKPTPVAEMTGEADAIDNGRAYSLKSVAILFCSDDYSYAD